MAYLMYLNLAFIRQNTNAIKTSKASQQHVSTMDNKYGRTDKKYKPIGGTELRQRAGKPIQRWHHNTTTHSCSSQVSSNSPEPVWGGGWSLWEHASIASKQSDCHSLTETEGWSDFSTRQLGFHFFFNRKRLNRHLLPPTHSWKTKVHLSRMILR